MSKESCLIIIMRLPTFLLSLYRTCYHGRKVFVAEVYYPFTTKGQKVSFPHVSWSDFLTNRTWQNGGLPLQSPQPFRSQEIGTWECAGWVAEDCVLVCSAGLRLLRSLGQSPAWTSHPGRAPCGPRDPRSFLHYVVWTLLIRISLLFHTVPDDRMFSVSREILSNHCHQKSIQITKINLARHYFSKSV